MRHVWSVLCDRVLIDRDTNNISLDTVEELSIGVPAEAMEQPKFLGVVLRLASLWDVGDKGAKGRVVHSITAPDGSRLGEATLEVDAAGGRLRTIAVLPGLPVIREGTYSFGVHWQEATASGPGPELANLPLQVRVTASAAPKPASQG